MDGYRNRTQSQPAIGKAKWQSTRRRHRDQKILQTRVLGEKPSCTSIGWSRSRPVGEKHHNGATPSASISAIADIKSPTTRPSHLALTQWKSDLKNLINHIQTTSHSNYELSGRLVHTPPQARSQSSGSLGHSGHVVHYRTDSSRSQAI